MEPNKGRQLPALDIPSVGTYLRCGKGSGVVDPVFTSLILYALSYRMIPLLRCVGVCEGIDSCLSTVHLFPHDIVPMVKNQDDPEESEEEEGVSTDLVSHTEAASVLEQA
ncbi:hypothetical protein AVEN_131645-1 [Araneus ventricosus]|uniref:Uncharacterized protein n=1 Tax=Araneus ventricosus TaxID=182803 RepID=A0A4Y2NL63_ARAVE|nr:hypothetical protein AVEN_131645-1 [Araneus ventricosus]